MTDTTKLGHVFYTDGGFRHVAGWGLHGYSYKLDGKEVTNYKKVEAPTNKGYHSKEKITTFGAPMEKDFVQLGDTEAKAPSRLIPVKPDQYVDAWGTVDYDGSTNNTAELKAALEGLKLANGDNSTRCAIVTDSQYVIGGATEWHKKWSANNWRKKDGTEVQNRELWKELLEEQKKLSNISWHWVKGHSGDLGNETSDTAATKGLNLARRGKKDYSITTWSPIGNYWNPKNPYNRFLSHPFWYFISNIPEDRNLSKDGRHVYYTGSHDGKNELGGKAARDHTYSVCMLKEPEAVLTSVYEEQSKVSSSDYEDIVYGYLSQIFLPKVYHELTTWGCDYVVPPLPNRSEDLILWDDLSKGGVQLTWVARPPKISKRIFDYCGMLEGILNDYLEKDDSLVTTDITDQFYEEVTKGKKTTTLLKKAVSTAPSLSVVANYKIGKEVEQRPLTVSLSLDCPSKNSLVRLAEREPSVTLVTWRESKRGFRYAVVIEADGDSGIWCSVHSNLIIVT